MRTPEGDRILQIIRTHVGRQHAITALNIARELHWPDGSQRTVRRIIKDESVLWTEPDSSSILVCSADGPDGGFFVAANIEEAFEHEHWLATMTDSWRTRLDQFRNQCRRLGIHFAKDAAPVS